MSTIIFLILLAGVLFILYLFYRNAKVLKVGSLGYVSGAVKAGKSAVSLSLALSEYKSIHRNWKIQKWFCELFNKPVPEEPLFYSNIPVGIKYSEIDSDLLTQKKRVRFKSVVYVDEASFCAGNEAFQNKPAEERLKFFNKLFGHSSHGGKLIYNSQSLGDTSIQVRRCVGSYFYVYDMIKWIPFILIAHVREFSYSEDGSVQNNVTEDFEESLKTVILSKSVFKKYDCYAFSFFTDDLPVKTDLIDGNKLKSLKAKKIIEFDGNDRTKEHFYHHEVKEAKK